MFKVLWRRKIGLGGFIVLISICLVAIFAPFVAPCDPYQLNPSIRLQPPNRAHLFGTDMFGRDILSRVLYGARLSLITGFSVALLSGTLGVGVGVVSAYFKQTGMILMRINDALMAFPEIILALALLAIAGHASLANVIIALGVTYAPRMARTAYGLALRIREFGYIEAAQAVGSGSFRIIFYHLLPNLISPVIVQTTFTCALAVLGAASLDFLGVGVSPEVPSWGAMVNEGRIYITIAPWVIVFPGFFVALLVLALNLLGDALRDALDPRLRRLV
jgi:peptide/nickel transport system permease protein